MDRCGPSSEVQKQSCGDLHSRLKTRKLLGVGTTEDGDVHRSKLSQILGHSEQLHIRIPRGLRPWQWILSITFLVVGTAVILLPRISFDLLMGISFPEDCSMIPARLFGATLFGLSATNWAGTDSSDKDIIRWSMLSNLIYFIAQLAVLVSQFYGGGTSILVAFIYVCLHMCGIVIASYFYWSMSARHHVFRARSSVDLKSFRGGLVNVDARKDL